MKPNDRLTGLTRIASCPKTLEAPRGSSYGVKREDSAREPRTSNGKFYRGKFYRGKFYRDRLPAFRGNHPRSPSRTGATMGFCISLSGQFNRILAFCDDSGCDFLE